MATISSNGDWPARSSSCLAWALSLKPRLRPRSAPSSVRKAWQKQEKRLAGMLGGTRNAGSGNGWVRKNDVRNRDYLVEAKWTEHRSYRLRVEDLLSLAHHADVEG